MTGLLVGGGDVEALTGAMRTLIEDAALRERLGAQARRRSERFAAAAVVPRFEAVYERLVAQARVKAGAVARGSRCLRGCRGRLSFGPAGAGGQRAPGACAVFAAPGPAHACKTGGVRREPGTGEGLYDRCTRVLARRSIDQARGADGLHGFRSSLSFLCAVRPQEGGEKGTCDARHQHTGPSLRAEQLGQTEQRVDRTRCQKMHVGQARRSTAPPEISMAPGARMATR